jgi:hypothetical protein
MNNNFHLIFKKYGSDKVSHHGYHLFYPQFIEKFRNSSDAMIEIGICDKKSLYSWLEYFPRSFVYGLDINLEEKGNNFHLVKLDQSSETQLNNFISNLKRNIFFINDDGSHIPEHQILTFSKLFDILQPGGVYIIEDIETSYWSKNGLYGYTTNYGFKHNKSIIEIFKNLVDYINYEFLLENNKKELSSLKPDVINEEQCLWINTITFCQNCIVITKKTQDEYNYFNRQYRFRDNL